MEDRNCLKLEFQTNNNSTRFSFEYYRHLFEVVVEILDEAKIYDKSLYSELDFDLAEFKIKANRVLNILDSCIKQIEVLFCLPIIFADNDSDIDKFANIEQKEVLVKLLGDESMFPTELSENLMDLIEILIQNDICQMTQFYHEYLSNDQQNLLMFLKQFKMIAEKNLMTTAAHELAEQNVFQKIRKRIHDLNRENKRLSQEIEDEESRTNAIQTGKREAFQRYLQDAKTLRQQQIPEIEKEIHKSNCILNQTCEKVKLKKETLQKVAERTDKRYKDLAEAHSLEENAMKSKRTELETELQKLLQKYDKDIGERSHLLDECTEKLAFEERQLIERQEKYKGQNIIYKEIVAEKEAEEARIREEKLFLFLMNRSAVVIQRAFRLMLTKRKSKKKGKGTKGKKGKK